MGELFVAQRMIANGEATAEQLAFCWEISETPLTSAVAKCRWDGQASWPDILADLNSLTETEVEQDGKRFVLRSAPRPAATLALRAAGLALPPTVRRLADA
jgi:hypothetical protein